MHCLKSLSIIISLLVTTSSYAQNIQSFKKYQNHQSEKNGLTNVERNGKWGFIDKTGKEVIPLIYDDNSWFQNGITWCKFKGKWGMIDEKGKCIIPFIYDNINWLDSKLVVAFLNGKCGIFTNAKELTPIIYDYIGLPNGSTIQHNRIPVRLNNKFGYLNTEGKLVLPIKYYAANPFQYCGLAAVSLNGYYGCIDVNGKTIVPFKYLFINLFEPRIAMANLNGHLGWVNIKGEVVVPFEYQDAKNSVPENGLTTIEKNGKWGAIDTAGRLFIPCKYDEPVDFKTSNISTEVHVNGKVGILGFSGKEIIPPKYDSAFTAPGGVCLNKKWAIINKDGKEVTRFIYDWASCAEWRGSNTVRLHGKMGLVSNVTGKPLTPLKYKSIETCYNYRHIVNYNNQFGVIDENGEQIIPTKYDSLHYAEKTFCIRFKNKWGFLDNEGKMLINPQYDNATVFYGGFAIVEKNNKWGSIDKKNNTVIPFQYQKAINSGGGEAIVCLKNKWGVVDRHNKIIKPIKYTYSKLMQILEAENNADETG